MMQTKRIPVRDRVVPGSSQLLDSFPVHSFPRKFMHITLHAARFATVGAAALCITACADDVTTSPHPLVSSFASASAGLGGRGFQFTPLSSSYACTVPGGDPVAIGRQ